MFVSVGYQAIAALRGMKELTSYKREAWPWYRPSGVCPLHRFEATCQFPHPAVGSSRMPCGCAWPRSLSLNANTGTTQEIQALNQSWGGCNHSTLNWPYQGHQVPYLVSWTLDCLPSLWSDTDHWPYAPRVCGIAGKWWWIQTSNSLNTLFETIPEICIVEFLQKAGFLYLISNGQPFWNCTNPRLGQCMWAWLFCSEIEKPLWETSTCVGRLICAEGHVSSLNKCNQIQSLQFIQDRWIEKYS